MPKRRENSQRAPTVQIAFRLPVSTEARLESVADALGLDVSNFLRLMILESLPDYEGRAAQVIRGEPTRKGARPGREKKT